MGSERFESIQAAGGFECFRIQLDRCVRGENACTAARIFLRVLRVRCAVDAEKESRIITNRRFDECSPIALALEDGQAVVVRANTAGENCIAVE